MRNGFVRWGRVGVALFLVALGGAGCDEGPLAPGAEEAAPVLRVLEPGIHSVLSVPAWKPMDEGGAQLSIRLYLKMVDVEGEIASYQGEFQFNTGVVEVLEVRVPEGLMGVWHESEAGVIRFAGLSLGGLADTPVLIIEIESKRAVRQEDFLVTLEEVVAVDGFQDLTESVVNREAPVLTTERLQRLR